jgi:hypothetical protein
MSAMIKIVREVFERSLSDVHRPHPFAFERVGFLWGRVAPLDSGKLVMINDYTPVSDTEYINDATVGARIGAAPIRMALQRALKTGEAVFHFHVHSHRGLPTLSRTDASEMAPLIASFNAVTPTAIHGALIASTDSAGAWVWPAHTRQPYQVDSVSVVGFPAAIWRAA